MANIFSPRTEWGWFMFCMWVPQGRNLSCPSETTCKAVRILNSSPRPVSCNSPKTWLQLLTYRLQIISRLVLLRLHYKCHGDLLNWRFGFSGSKHAWCKQAPQDSTPSLPSYNWLSSHTASQKMSSFKKKLSLFFENSIQHILILFFLLSQPLLPSFPKLFLSGK